MESNHYQSRTGSRQPHGRINALSMICVSALLWSSLVAAEPMKFEDIKIGSVISEQIELPQRFGSSDWFPLPPGNWVVQAIDPDRSPGGIRTGSYYLALTNQDPLAKMPMISIGPSLKTAGWNFRGCGAVNASKSIYYVSGADMPTFANEGKCASVRNYDGLLKADIDYKIKANSASVRWTSIWMTASLQPSLLTGKKIQSIGLEAAPWGGHAFDIAMLVEAAKDDVAPNNVLAAKFLDWIHLNADLLTQAAAGKKVALTAFPAF